MNTLLESVRQTLTIEAEAIFGQIEHLNGDFEKAAQLIAASKGKIVVTGIGKSGIIGRKVSATLASTGTPSFFLHPAEAFHGDLGMVTGDDIVLAFSNSGETDEVLKIIPFFREDNNKIVSITGNPKSTLARNSDVHVQIYISKEACPLNLAPTTSTTVMLAIGDALAIAVMKIKDFSEESFARFHPGGALGRRLLVRVEDVMRKEGLPFIKPESTLRKIIDVMSRGRLGMALVNEEKVTIGVITDGDLRRLFESKGKDAFDLKAKEIMTHNPKTIKPADTLSEAEKIFNDRKINSLIVIDDSGETVGVIQIYNL